MRSFSLLFVVSLAGCGASSASDESNVPITLGHEKDAIHQPGVSEPTSSNDGKTAPNTNPEQPGPTFGCRLSAPVVSDDACSKDADCAPSTPCHARACVAVAKATPRTPDTMCTMNIDCQSADVNPCSCYQGHCALVPKNP